MTTTLHHILFAMGIGRIILGIAPFIAAAQATKLLGFPVDQDNAAARLMGRLFGVRDVGLGVLVFWGLEHPEHLPALMLFQAFTDFGDMGAAAIPLLGRHGIDRAAVSTAAMAGSAGVAWLVAHSFVS